MTELACAVCGSPRVTQSIEGSSGAPTIVCDACYEVVLGKAREIEAAERAVHRHHLRELGQGDVL